MITNTLYTTWMQLFGEHFDDSGFDPENLMPTEYSEACFNHLLEQCEEYLEEYGCTILGNGEIIRRHHTSEDFDDFEDFDEEDFKDFVAAIEYDHIFEQYA